MLCWLKSMQIRSKATVAGASQLRRNEGDGRSSRSDWAPAVATSTAGERRAKMLRSSFGEGRRGAHERNCASISFISIISCSSQVQA